MSAVKKLVGKVIERGYLPPYIPYWFIQQGMMERVSANIIYQNFCKENSLIRTGVSYCVHSNFIVSHLMAHLDIFHLKIHISIIE